MMPDNAAYYHAAYIVAALLYGGYILSLAWRSRRYRSAGAAHRKAGDLDSRAE